MSDLYDLPNGWEWKKLSDIGKISTGKTPPKANKEFYENGTIRFVKPPNLQNSSEITKLETDEFITEDGAKKSTLLPKNTLMVCCIGSLGKFALSTENVITNQQINSIVFNEKVIDYKYGYYYGFKFEKLLNEVANEAVVKIVNKSIFSNLDIPLPPLLEQQRIVSKLDKLFEKIDKSIALHQKNMAEADVFMGSVLNDVFGELEEKYGKTDLKDITIITMGQSPSSDTYNSNGDGIPFFQGKKEFGKLNPTVEQYCTEPKKIAKDGDILMSVRAPVGPTNIANLDCAIGRGLCSIRAKENQFTMYIYYFLNHFEKEIEGMGKGSTFSAINKTEIETLKVPFIPLHIQQKVVKYLDEVSIKIEKVKSIQKEKMDSLKALKASILDKAFRGEL